MCNNGSCDNGTNKLYILAQVDGFINSVNQSPSLIDTSDNYSDY